MNRFLTLVLAITRGILRDRTQRRQAMSVLLGASLVLLALGVFPLWGVFATRPLFFAIYWLVCAWLTICCLLLAIYDLAIVARRGREERETVRRRIFKDLD